MDDKLQCALRALTLCDTTRSLSPAGSCPCYCRTLVDLADGDQDTVGAMVRWTRAVEVARAHRQERYVVQSHRGEELRRLALEF